jgi:hypothetical protein
VINSVVVFTHEEEGQKHRRLLLTIVAISSSTLVTPSTSQTKQRPYSIPTPYNFSNSNTESLLQIEVATCGLANRTNNVHSRLSPEGMAQFQLIVANKLFEAASFSALLYKFTSNVTGSQYDKQD